MKSYHDIYSQIKQMIGASSGEAVRTQGISGGPSMSSTMERAIGALSESFQPYIVYGLEVLASDPPSMTVTIKAGLGYVGGSRAEVPEDTIITIPSGEAIWYVLINAGVRLSKFPSNNSLVAGKIIIEADSLRIVQDRLSADGPDGYIVDGRSYYNSQKYDPSDLAFRDAVASAMPNIFAENIFGTINLSENLKISNSKGTMEARSDGMRFFDSSGRVLAEYLSTRARIAGWSIEPGKLYSQNILIDSANESIGTADFVSGALGKGWRITPEEAEFQNARIRGVFSTAVFKKDTISASNAMNIWSNSSVLKVDLGSNDSDMTVTVEDAVFSIGERVRLKDGFNDEWMAVTAGPTANGNYWNYTVTRDLAGSYSVNNNPAWKIGTAIVSFGNWNGSIGTGFIMLDAASANAPYIDYYMRTGGAYDSYAMKARIGRLTGVTDPDFGNLSGYGLYAENAYLKGSLFLGSGMQVGTGYAGSRIALTSSELQAYNGATQTFKLSATNGSFIFGDVSEVGNFVKYDPSTGGMTIKGSITITGGSVPWSSVSGTGKPADYADVTSVNTAAAIAGQGALATKSNVDLATAEVLNKTANYLTYTAGGTVDSLKPAQAGADVTGSNTSYDTARVNNVAASTVQGGSARANAGLDTSGNVLTKILPASAIGVPGSAGLYLGSDYLGYYNGGWKSVITNTGQFYFGNGTLAAPGTDNYIYWNGSTLAIRGDLTADDITAGGTITGNTIQTAASPNARIELSAGTKEARWYKSGGGLIASIGVESSSDPTLGYFYYNPSVDYGATTYKAVNGIGDFTNFLGTDDIIIGVYGEGISYGKTAYGVYGKSWYGSGTSIGGRFDGITADMSLNGTLYKGDTIQNNSAYRRIAYGIIGEITSGGAINKGSGFGVSVVSNVYTITFTTAFSVAPVITASCIGTNYIHNIQSITTSGFNIRWVDRGTSSSLATAFSFSAIIPS